MIKAFFLVLIMFTFLSCNPKPIVDSTENSKSYSNITEDKDTLFSINEDGFEYGSSCGYANKNGETIIPNGTFELCFTETFGTFAYVYDRALYGNNIVAINRNKEVIFEAFLFDNGPDYLSEGLFRIERNGKIGFADETGIVVIEPIYKCAYPFENGTAKVSLDCESISDNQEHTYWESKTWIHINKNGEKVK